MFAIVPNAEYLVVESSSLIVLPIAKAITIVSLSRPNQYLPFYATDLLDEYCVLFVLRTWPLQKCNKFLRLFFFFFIIILFEVRSFCHSFFISLVSASASSDCYFLSVADLGLAANVLEATAAAYIMRRLIAT